MNYQLFIIEKKSRQESFMNNWKTPQIKELARVDDIWLEVELQAEHDLVKKIHVAFVDDDKIRPFVFGQECDFNGTPIPSVTTEFSSKLLTIVPEDYFENKHRIIIAGHWGDIDDLKDMRVFERINLNYYYKNVPYIISYFGSGLDKVPIQSNGSSDDLINKILKITGIHSDLINSIEHLVTYYRSQAGQVIALAKTYEDIVLSDLKDSFINSLSDLEQKHQAIKGHISNIDDNQQ